MNKPKPNQETLLFLMRITLLHIILTSFSIVFAYAVDTMGQEILNRKVTIDIESEEFHEVLMLITEQTKVKFAYSPQLIEDQKKVTLHLKEAKLGEVLTSLLGPDINYKVVGKRIVLRPVVQPSSEDVEEVRSLTTLAIQVTGTVSESGGAPMPGVSIVVKGTSVGTTTDTNGRYSISVDNESDILVFSFIGYATQEVTVGSRTVVDVVLSEDATQLSEVVVTALGIERESKTLVYATQTVNPTQLTEVRDANNVLNSLQGKIANAVVTQGSGGPGSGARIVLRGNRSIQRSNNALIVVDGVPINNTTNGTAGSDFGSVAGSDGASSINPDDIESITVLKGASAAALYGSQAGNGVIVITTKKGKKDSFSIDVNSGITAEQVFAIPEFQNSYGQGNAGTLDPSSGESWGAKMTGQPYTNYLGQSRSYSSQPDNVKDFFRTGMSLNNSVGISGGSDKMQTYLSYANNDVQGIVRQNDMRRHTLNLRLSNQFSKRFSTDAKITYLNQQIGNRPRTGEENAPVIDIYQIPRNVSNDDAKQFEIINDLGIPVPQTWPSTLTSIYQNPYWMINRTALNESRDRLMGFVTAKFQIADWLNIQGRANVDKTIDNNKDIYSQGTILWATQPGGYYAERYITKTQQWYDVILQGNNRISENFNIDYRVGAIFLDDEWKEDISIANGLNVINKFSLNFATTPSFDSDFSHSRTHSAFAQANVSFKDAIFLEGSFRRDWSSTIESPYHFDYPSIGLSAVISDLTTLPNIFSFLKVNVNYAQVGNGASPYLIRNSYSYSQGAGNGFIGRGTTKAIENLKPELVENIELGFETRILNDRLGVAFNFYRSNSTNQLLRLSLPTPTGYLDKYVNAGNIRNQGIELVVNATPVKTEALTWDVAYNLGINRNKIVSLLPELKRTTLAGGYGRSATPIVEEGGSFGDLLSYKWQRDENGNFVVNAAGLPVQTTAQEYIGNFNPDATMGLTNTLQYKRFSVRLLIDGRVGGTVVSGTEMNLAFSGITEGTESFREGGWNLGGVNAEGTPVDQTVTAQQFWQIASGKRYGIGEFFAYDATSFRVRELSIGYDIPVPEGFFLKSARLSLVARNLMWLFRGESILDIPGIGKRKMWFDPDMSLGNGNFQGVEYGTLPSTRSLGLNLRLQF